MDLSFENKAQLVNLSHAYALPGDKVFELMLRTLSRHWIKCTSCGKPITDMRFFDQKYPGGKTKFLVCQCGNRFNVEQAKTIQATGETVYLVKE